jgi:hypothetical protein
MDELSVFVGEYQHNFKPNDASEWNTVLSEIETFMEAEKKLSPLDQDGKILQVPNRLKMESSAKFDDTTGMARLKLQEAILVGNYQSQIKFSELTIDMFRLLQSLERVAPVEGSKIPPPAPTPMPDESALGIEPKEEEPKVMARRSNPRKFLLYRPTFAQLMLYLSTSFKDTAENSAFLLYLSADGSKRTNKNASNSFGIFS